MSQRSAMDCLEPPPLRITVSSLLRAARPGVGAGGTQPPWPTARHSLGPKRSAAGSRPAAAWCEQSAGNSLGCTPPARLPQAMQTPERLRGAAAGEHGALQQLSRWPPLLASPNGHLLGGSQHGGIHLLQLVPKVLAHDGTASQGGNVLRSHGPWERECSAEPTAGSQRTPCRACRDANYVATPSTAALGCSPSWGQCTAVLTGWVHSPCAFSACRLQLLNRCASTKPLSMLAPRRPAAPPSPPGWPCGCRQSRGP